MTTYTIDLNRVHSLYELHDHLEEVLPLPDYYGRNMDALWDPLHCWFESPDEVTIEVLGMDRISKGMEVPVSRLKSVLDDLQNEDGIHVIYRWTTGALSMGRRPGQLVKKVFLTS